MTASVRYFYNRDVETEWHRLENGLQRAEFASTLRLIELYFPASGHLYDIGPGPGRYALELARRGYRVSLVDLAENSLTWARDAFRAAGLTAERFIEGDARDLGTLEDESCDAALFLGPLYHITDASGRTQALTELRRVLKPGGIAIAAYLNSWGILRTGVADFPTWFRDLEAARSLLAGRAFSSEELKGFTEAYWSTPLDAMEEVTAAGFDVITYAGVEGFCGGMWPMVAALAESDPAACEGIIALAAETSELPQYRDATDHLHIVLRRPV
jgi:S-adenosylmethionine-dependent methyltransferase